MMSEKYHIERYRPIYNVRHDDTQESIFNVVLSTLHINVVAELLPCSILLESYNTFKFMSWAPHVMLTIIYIYFNFTINVTYRPFKIQSASCRRQSRHGLGLVKIPGLGYAYR